MNAYNITPFSKGLTFFFTIAMFCLSSGNIAAGDSKGDLKLNDREYLERRGVNILVFSNCYEGSFSDAKMSGIEIIHHGVRTVTNGDIRLNSTPEQWDPIPKLIERKVNKNDNSIEVYLSYPAYNFNYMIKVEADGKNVHLSVNLKDPLPEKLQGVVGFNLEFLPSAYFEKTYMMDNKCGLFPLYPNGPMTISNTGKVEQKPLASGHVLVLAPEDPYRRIEVNAETGILSLFDGRNRAQNGWFVVRSLISSGKTGKVI